MLGISCKVISLDEVAVNDIPSYRPIRVQNKTDSQVSVSLSASSPLLRFQLRNENYEAIQQVGIRDSLYVYSEAFDLVGLITSFELAPQEEKQIIVSFRADPAAFSHLVTGAQVSPFSGTVQFTATSLLWEPPAQPKCSGRIALEETIEASKVEENKNGGKPAKRISSPVTAGPMAKQNQTLEQRTECITLPFRANVYVSFLKLSATEIQVALAPNKTQVVDFVVTNTSCQPALFLIRDQTKPVKGLDIALYEADKFEDPKLGHRILLDGYASMTFSLMLRSSGANANTQQQYRTVLQCDNLRDSRNTTLVYVSVNVGTESQGDVLAFSDTSIDFGDVYRGTKAFAQVRIQNIGGREDAVLRLADTDRRKYDGKFSLMKGDLAVDELTIAAQKGNPFTTVTLMYQPSYDVDSKEAAKKKFDVELLAQSASLASSQRVVIRCAAMLYTSNIVASQRSVNFGDCQVGQSKRYTLQIENHSPLQGKIVVQLRSKIIQIEGISRTNKNGGRELHEEFTIAPSASLPLTLKITPQRVNPMYRKQLTIINASNPAEDRQVINIEANNMAPLDTKLHDELYSWKCDLGGDNNGGNVDSADGNDNRRGPSTLWAISNLPLLVPYSVQSKVNHEVVLNLRSSSPEIEVFYCSDTAICNRLGEITAELRRLCLYGDGEDSSYLTNESAEQMFKAREELLKLLSETSQNITNRIVLEPNASLKAYALIIRTACPTEPLTKEDGISIAVDGIEAPRFVRLSYRLCGTTFELSGQKTKNFGEVNIGVKKTTKLPIVNRCNSFLFLHFSKSRSVTAEHIRMEHSEKQSIFLTIRPYASREIELTLYPGIKGIFQEKIWVTNILNIQNFITITIKAVVTKADTFEISPDSWTFEMMVPPSANVPTLMAPSPAALPNLIYNADDGGNSGGSAISNAVSNARVGAKFTLANTSNSRRQIIARVELTNSNAAAGVTASNPYLAFPGVKVAVQLDMTLTGASSVSTRKLEEQIEKLEQKLKIYVRKKKTEKADNARRKIEAYKLALKGEEVDLTALETAQSGTQGSTDHELSESEDEGSTNALQALKSKTQQSDIVQLLRREGVALPSMGAGESVIITLFLVCKRALEESIPVTQSQTINILFYEARDQEANRIIPIDMILMRTPGDVQPQQLPAAPDAAGTAAPLLVSSIPSSSKVGVRQGQPNGDLAHGDTATNLLTAPSFPKGAPSVALSSSTSSILPSRTQQARPPPTIRLTTTGVVASGTGGGRLRSTFMGHPLLVLRNCIVNDQTEFTFLVEADSDTTIVVLEPRRCGGSVPEVLDARFKLFPRNGHVRQQEPLRIVVECTARGVGPQKYFIPVKNIRNASDVHYLTVEMNPTEEIDMLTTEPKELFFRDVITPCAPSQLEAQVVLIRSRFPFPHALVVRTNKPSQLALFEDASCTIPLIHPIRRVFFKETVRVYVQLRPGARYVDPRARNIHAGVLVEALAPNPAVSSTAFCIVGKAVLRAVAYVGSGLVEVPRRSLELGCVQPTQHYVKTEFTLRNSSYNFSLRVALVPSSPLVEVVEVMEHEEGITLAPLEEHAVPLVLHLPAPGLAKEYIDVVNHSSAQAAIRVSLSALRLNDGIMQVEPALNTPLKFPMAAVVRGENCKELHLHQPVSCSIKMANYHNNREVVLATTAITPTARELPLWFHTSDEETQVLTAIKERQRQVTNDDNDGGGATGTVAAIGVRPGTTVPISTPTSSQLPSSTYVKGRVELQANRAQVIMWTLTDLPALTADEVEAVLQHQLVTITSTMQICVTYTAHSAKTAAASGGWQSHASPRSHNNRYRGPAVGQCVLLVPITLSLSMSEGRAEPAVVSLGLVAKPPSPPASPVSAIADVSSDEDDTTEADVGTPAGGADNSNSNEEAALAARVRRRRRVRLAQLRRPGNHQQFSSYNAKSGLQQSSSHNMVVSFRLVNLSSVMPLPLKVECPPVIHFSQTRLTLPPGASMSVEATLNLKLITTQGSFRYEAFFVNEWNPENDMAVCITGQHYWKVFKILRTDTEAELRDAVTLPPLRVETSLQAPLSELKLAFVATEPDVEFDLHVQQNPQLEGLLELLLLHYDATSTAQHLSFRSDVLAPPVVANATATSINGAVVANGAGAASSLLGALTSSAVAAPGAASGSGVGSGGGGAGAAGTTGGANLTSPNNVASPRPACGVGAAVSHSGTSTPLLLSDDAAAKAAGTATAAITTTNGIGSNVGLPLPGTSGAGAAAMGAAQSPPVPTTAAAPINAVSTLKSRKADPGASSGTGGGGGTLSTATTVTTRSQRLRLRCMLRSSDLASLVSIFYGFRRSRANAAAANPSGGQSSGEVGGSAGATTTTTAAAATIATSGGGSGSASAWTYDRIAEIERRSAGLVSNNVWLGTTWVANPFTEDEEVQVYGTLSPFRTFSAPPKVVLRPSRISVETPRWLTQSDNNSNNSRVLQVGYVGEIAVTNEFDRYVADISVVVLVSDRLGVPLEIDVRGGQRVVSSASPSSAAGGTATASLADTVCSGSIAAEAASGATPPFNTTAPASVVATSFVAAGASFSGGAAPVSQPHCVQLGPHETAVLTVVVRPALQATAAAASTPPLSLTLLEQFVTVLIVDDNIPFSYYVSRVNVVTPVDGVEALPTVTLMSATATAPSQKQLSSAADISGPPTAVGPTAVNTKGGDKNAQGPTPAPADPPGETSSTTASPSAMHRAGESSPEPPLSRVSGRSSTHTSHGGVEEGGVPPLAAAAELRTIDTASVDTADAARDAAGGASLDMLPVQPRLSGWEVTATATAENRSIAATPVASTMTTSTATTVAPSFVNDAAFAVAAATPRHWVLSLRNCEPLPGCGGAYTSTFSVARDDTCEPNIQITNHLPTTAVRYFVQVVAQSPQVWLLLTASSGLLQGGERQPLRLQVLSSDVGSFVGYVAITNSYDTREVVYLRVSAEVFVPGTAEGLFDVIAMNGGHRLSTTNAVHNVDMGALYGAGTTRTLIALEIVNKGNVALEFPVSVVHPMRQELRPIPQSAWNSSAVAASSHRRQHANAAAASMLHPPFALHTDVTANTPTSLSISLATLPNTTQSSLASTATTPAAGVTADSSLLLLHGMPTHTQPPQRSPQKQQQSHHTHHHTSSHHRHAVSRMSSTATASAGTAASAPATAVSAATINSSSATVFEGKLVVCHIHNVAMRTGQKYFVVDPRSPLRLAFLLSCTALHDIPEGYGVFGEADVVLKCKQARDAQVTFNVKFEAFKPTFAVALEYDMDAAEKAAAAAARIATNASGEVAAEGTRLATPSPAGMSLTSLPPSAVSPGLRPIRITGASVTNTNINTTNDAATPSAASSARWAETTVAVTNLSCTHTQVFVLFSQSEVLTLAPADGASEPQSAPPGIELLPSVLGAMSGDEIGGAAPGVLAASPAVEVTVPPKGVGAFVVRLDRLRAEALLNFDKDESKLTRPALCEHAYLYNKGNPRERVQLLFRQQAVAAQLQRASRVDAATITVAGPVSPTLADTKPVKGNNTQHFSERYILSFAQRFSAVLTSLADCLPFVGRADDAADGAGGNASFLNGGGFGNGPGETGAAVSGGKDCAGDYAGGMNSISLLGTMRASAAANPAALSGTNTPGQPHGRGGDDDGGSGAVKGSRNSAGLRGDSRRLDTLSSDDSDTTGSDDDSTASAASNSSDCNNIGGDSDSSDEVDRTLNSTLTEDSGGMLGRTERDAGDEMGSRDLDAEGPVSRVGGFVTTRATRSSSEGFESERCTRQRTPSVFPSHGRMRSGESSADVLPFSPNSPPPLSAGGGAVGNTCGCTVHRSHKEARWCKSFATLHDLLVELTWLCDELLFYAVLLRNSRHVEACGAFLVSAVSQHPVMVAWRRRRGGGSSRARAYDIFLRFLETIDALPRVSNSTS